MGNSIESGIIDTDDSDMQQTRTSYGTWVFRMIYAGCRSSLVWGWGMVTL